MTRIHRQSALAALCLVGAMPLGAQARRSASAAAPAASALVSAPIRDIRYDVTFDAERARRRALGVAMSFDVAGTAPVLLSLPAWTPGAYEISYFARNVLNFTATGGATAGSGQPLEWDKVDPDTWRVRPTRAGRVEVSFDYQADTLDNAMAWTQPDFALFNGTNVFPYPEGRPLDYRSAVVVHTEADWLVATGMEPGNGQHAFTAANFHDLVDMPFFVGRFDFDSAEVSGKWTRFATYPAGSVAGQRRETAWGWIKRVIPPEVAVFGEVPWRTYTVMQIADSSYGGASGLEHQNSHVDVITPLALDDPFVPSLYAHEIFHAWNVKRLRPAELVPYRYEVPQPTTLLWVSEGITDYYADLAQVRGGTIDSAGFFRLTSGKIDEVSALPPVALEDASLSTWVHPVDGTAYAYYPKGSLAGFMLDIMIRDASDNRRSLDDVMRALYESTYKQGRGFTREQWWAAVSRAAGGQVAASNGVNGPASNRANGAAPSGVSGFADFEHRYVDGREPYPWSTMLPLAGMRLRADTTRVPQIGVRTAAGGDSAGVLVVGVDAESAADAAGVRPGDYLLGVGDITVTDPAFGERFRAQYGSAADGSPLALRVRRGSETLTLPGTVRFTTRVERSIEADASASPKAARIRDGILRGTTDR